MRPPTRQFLLRSTRPVLPPHYLGEEVDSERSGTPPSAAQLASGAGGIRVTQTGQRLRRLPLLVSCSSSRGSHRHAEQVSGDSVLACLTLTAQPPAPSASSRPGALSAILSQKPRRAAEAASTCAWVTQPAQVWTMPRGARPARLPRWDGSSRHSALLPLLSHARANGKAEESHAHRSLSRAPYSLAV